MKSLLGRRPSPALVISCISLFVSLGGVSYGVATGFIDSREIKNNQVRSADLRNNSIRTFDLRNNEVRGFDIRNSTVQGRDVALNTLTGADVSEQDLGKVPSAAAADSAASAASAGGVTPKALSYAAEAGGAFVSVLSLGGLTLEARCVAPAELEVRATTTAPDSEIATDFPLAQPASSDFDPGESFLAVSSATAMNDGVGSIVYAGADGRVVTVEALVREDANDVRGTTNDCGFFGVAQAG